MLLLADRENNSIEPIEWKPFNLSENQKIFNFDLFSGNEEQKAKRWVQGEDICSKYEQQFKYICNDRVKIFTDLEFEDSSNSILSIGVTITFDNQIVEKYSSYISPENKVDLRTLRRLKIKFEDLEKAPTLKGVLFSIEQILTKYERGQMFLWGNQDMKMLNSTMVADCSDYIFYQYVADSIDLQEVIGKRFEVRSISLQNILINSSYLFVHTFDALEDSMATSFVYLFAEELDSQFVNGIKEFKEVLSKKTMLEHFLSLKKNVNIYKKRVIVLQNKKRTDKEDTLLRKTKSKLNKYYKFQENLDIEEITQMLQQTQFSFKK